MSDGTEDLQMLADKLIKFIADSLEKNVPYNEIEDAVKDIDDLPFDKELILIAGRILYEHRKNALPKKTLIKRIM